MPDPSRVRSVPERWGDEAEQLRKTAHAVNALQKGKGNNAFAVTLRPNETSTDLTVEFARSGGVAQLTAQTASAAQAAGVHVEVKNGMVTITHDNSPSTDRTFGVVIFG